MKQYVAYLSLFLITLLSLSAEGNADLNPINFTEYLLDSNNQFQVESLKTPEYRSRFSPILHSTLNFGYSNDTHWFRITPPRGDWLLEVESSILDQVTLYRPLANGGFDQSKAGDSISFKEQELPYHTPLFKLTQSTGSSFFLRVQSSGSVQIPLKIWSTDGFLQSAVNTRQIAGFYLGTMLVMVIYNLFLFLSTKDKNYIFYTLYISAFILFQGSLTGFTQQYLWPESPIWNSKSITFFVGLVVLTSVQFSRYFLQSWLQVPRLDILMKALMVGGIICMTFVFIAPYNLMALFSNLLGIGLVFIVLPAGYISLKQGYRPARFFVIAWTTFLLGILFQGFMLTGIMPHNTFTVNSMPIGSMLEVVLLSLALADRFKNLMLEKELAQLKFNDQLRELNQNLELQVSIRTEELLIAKEHAERDSEKLTEKNKELHFLASNDVLTGVMNRRAFLEHAELMVADAKRNNYTDSLILIDIDKFKNVNDQYGHQAGDMVLKAIGALLKKSMRQSDRIARYGGEEFIALLSHSTENEAMEKAEQLRKNLLKLRFNFDLELVISASFGVTSIQQNDIELDELIYKADSALYESKRLGRNRTTYLA